MREILFRGKRKDNGEWIEGYLVKLGKESFSDTERYGICKDAEYDDTADKLAEVLNSYERKGYKIQEIIEVREGFFRIIYTSEDEMIRPGLNSYFDVGCV